MALDPVPFGRYRLLNLLGEGGMAKVFRAILSGPLGFEKEVAVKRIDSKLTEDERVVKALINEARLGGQLRHKNIVEIYEFNQVDGNYFMAMEYVDGWTLDAVLRSCRANGEKLPGSIVAEMLISVCRGLEYAHTLVSKDGQPLNLVHRDLKPGNIIVSREGDVKIMDFGIAKADTNLYKTTAADVTKGTPIYMSPEQVTGGKLDQRSDLFSMGSILHELTTLQVPFVGDNLLAIMHAILNADIAEARERVKKRLPAMEPILVKCMARNPEERFSSAREVEKALRSVMRDLPPGPTLLEWVEDFAANLPAATATGEFGPDGAPIPQHGKMDEGTQSLAAVGTKDKAPAQKRRAEAVPEVSVGDDLFDSFGNTVAVEAGDPDASLNTKEAAFFDTDGGAPNVGRTRAVPAQGNRQRKRKAPPRKKKKPVLLAAAVTFGVVIFGAVALIALQLLKPPPAPVAEPVEEPTATVGEEPADLSLGSLAADEPTPAPVEAATPAPKPRTTPKPPKKDPVVTNPDPTPAPTPAPVAEVPALVGTGTVSLNSKPWSTVIVDGRVLGSTPVQGHSLPAGKHTVVFDCSACSPPAKSTVVVEIKADQLTKKIVRF